MGQQGLQGRIDGLQAQAREADDDAAPVGRRGCRSTKPRAVSRSTRLVIVPLVTRVSATSCPGRARRGRRRVAAPSTSNSQPSRSCSAKASPRARSSRRARRETRESTASGVTSRSGRSWRQAPTMRSTPSRRRWSCSCVKNTHVKYLDIKIYPGKAGRDGLTTRAERCPPGIPDSTPASVTNAPALHRPRQPHQGRSAPQVVVDLGCGNGPPPWCWPSVGPTRGSSASTTPEAMIETPQPMTSTAASSGCSGIWPPGTPSRWGRRWTSSRAMPPSVGGRTPRPADRWSMPSPTTAGSPSRSPATSARPAIASCVRWGRRTPVGCHRGGATSAGER